MLGGFLGVVFLNMRRTCGTESFGDTHMDVEKWGKMFGGTPWRKADFAAIEVAFFPAYLEMRHGVLGLIDE